jgi:hypothetical protein
MTDCASVKRVGEVESERDLWKHIDEAFRDSVYIAKVPWTRDAPGEQWKVNEFHPT